MELSEMKLKDIVAIMGAINKPDDTAFEVGTKYFIRTVTLYYTGLCKRITSKELVLKDAAWIAETGRFSDALKTGELSEIEPFQNDVIVPRDCIIDATEWGFDLPKTKK